MVKLTVVYNEIVFVSATFHDRRVLIFINHLINVTFIFQL